MTMQIPKPSLYNGMDHIAGARSIAGRADGRPVEAVVT